METRRENKCLFVSFFFYSSSSSLEGLFYLKFMIFSVVKRARVGCWSLTKLGHSSLDGFDPRFSFSSLSSFFFFRRFLRGRRRLRETRNLKTTNTSTWTLFESRWQSQNNIELMMCVCKQSPLYKGGVTSSTRLVFSDFR